MEDDDDDDDDDDEEANKMKPVSPAVEKEVSNTLIQQEAACIVIDDNQISFILKSNTNKMKYK